MTLSASYFISVLREKKCLLEAGMAGSKVDGLAKSQKAA
jgi:hypothetical protein